MSVARRVKRSASTCQSASSPALPIGAVVAATRRAGRRRARAPRAWGARVAGRGVGAGARRSPTASSSTRPSGVEWRAQRDAGEPLELGPAAGAQLRRLEHLGRLAHGEHPGDELLCASRTVVENRMSVSPAAPGLSAAPSYGAIVPQREKWAATHQAMSAAHPDRGARPPARRAARRAGRGSRRS